MGRMTKKKVNDDSVKGQTSLTSFFSKKPAGQSQLFTHVLSGVRVPPPRPRPPAPSSVPFKEIRENDGGNNSDDDGRDFQSEKGRKQRTGPDSEPGGARPSRLAVPEKDKRAARKRDLPPPPERRRGGPEATRLAEEAAAAGENSSGSRSEESEAGTTDGGDHRPRLGLVAEPPDSGPATAVFGGRSRPTAYLTPRLSCSCGEDRAGAEPESQGSPITVIPETPEIDPISASAIRRRGENRGPGGNAETSLGAFVPETPSPVLRPAAAGGSAGRRGREAIPKRGLLSRRAAAVRRGREPEGRAAGREALSSSVRRLPESVAEAPGLLEELLEEFAQCPASGPRQKPPARAQDERLRGRSKTSSAPSIANAGPRKTRESVSDDYADGTQGTPASRPPVGCDLEDGPQRGTDPLEEMLQAYAASSSRPVQRSDVPEVSASPAEGRAALSAGGPRAVAKRPSSKLSRTFRKRCPSALSDPLSPIRIPGAEGGSHCGDRGGTSTTAEPDSLSLGAARRLPNSPDRIPSLAADVEDLLGADTVARSSSPFAPKPSAVRLRAPASRKPRPGPPKLARLAAGHNMRKRSPCKGSSPYAKRHSSAARVSDPRGAAVRHSPLAGEGERPLPSYEDETLRHAGMAAKKALFQDEKENLSADFGTAEARSPSRPGPQSRASRHKVSSARGGSPAAQGESVPPFESSRGNCADVRAEETVGPRARKEGLPENVAPEKDSVTSSQAGPPDPLQDPDQLWGNELSESLLAAMDMDDESFGTDGDAEKGHGESGAAEILRGFRLLSPFKKASQSKPETPLPADLNRYKVTAVQDLRSERVLSLQCLTERVQKSCSLKGVWCNTFVEEGDTVAVHGMFDAAGMCTVDQQNNFLVVHPDLMLTGTSIARSIRCMRRSLLGEQFKGMDRASKPMLLGTILHDIFDKAIEGRNFSEAHLTKVIDKVAHQLKYLTDMYAVGMAEKNVLEEAREYLATMKQWSDRYLQPNPKHSSSMPIKMPGESQSEKCNVCIPRVKEIEETVWSPRWGMKGKVDLTVEVKIHPTRSKKSQVTVPLELKTGRQTNSIEHRSQLVLYSLMLGDIQGESASDLGLLLYLKTGAMLSVPANHMDKRELVHLRNQLAHHVSRRAKLDALGQWQLPRLPAPIEDDFTCGHCPHAISCALLQRTDSGDSCDDSDELSDAGLRFFAEQIGHLQPVHRDYFSHWYLLCKLEGAATEKRKQTKGIWCTEATDREVRHAGQCLSNLLVCGCRHNLSQDTYLISFQRAPGHTGPSVLDFQVSKGDRVAVSVMGTRQVATCTGFVESITAAGVTISSERPLQSISRRVYRMDKDDAYNSMASSLVNLARLMGNDENAHRLRQLVVELQNPEFDETPQIPSSAKTQVADILRDLNQDQCVAIDAVLRSQDYTLIVGMPGTGKTTTIVALVRILCACNLSVLLTSYTHSAVDNILLKLVKFGISPLRLGEAHRVHAALGPYTTKEALGQAGSVQQLASTFETKLVVATTCLGVKHALLTRRQFDICIVDEASQVSQLVCLGPLLHARRFVLVGDHKQLPPLVQSSAARQLGMDESLFQRLGLRHEATPLAAVQLLSLQYRMNADIMALSNGLVYGGQLRCGNDAVATATLNLPRWGAFRQEFLDGSEVTRWELQALEPAVAVAFLSTDKVRYPDSPNEKHTVNSGEARLVKHLVHCLAKCGCPPAEIGIISPYRNQCKLLASGLDQGIEVNTVDKYQGRDKEVIIVSFAAKEQQSETGFLLQDVRRLNVALTRAKHKLILVGSIQALRKNQPMEALLDCLQSSNLIASLPSDAYSSCSLLMEEA